ncbi:NADH-quinone oxidoreductase subunit NuoN [Novilysobacter defluvii]|uniref:NADH-quinone oxidoreductase subunit N n=1 Tax=Lysobacter defluvii IMMIB APB-9 = DSM 18482 TaxID=1385515 RepID=A0A0A0M6E3_9GAMM|nr:NADH-quinone oxidoreductase subunit NuoN [Lysobacter defluvii]KGO98558.1 NADH:ubiquinone oxidoreductase subunit N [Lysobacter defluvii IMMIB APB-9 = DSM 18482]
MIAVPVRSAADLMPLLPELVLVGGAFALLMLDLFLSQRHKVVTHVLATALLVLAGVLLAAGVGGQGEVFNGMFVRDTAADVLKIALCLVGVLSMVFVWPYLRDRGLWQGEVAVLMLFATVGMMLLVSAGTLVMVYVGLEMLALCSYALVVADRDSPIASEAGIKYFVLGSLASGLLLYGMSLVYGATGSLYLDEIAAAMGAGGMSTMLVTGVVFMVAGIAFKFGAAPFHMWLPDVYHGAPTAISLFIGSAPKLATFGMTYRLLEVGAGPMAESWQLALAWLAVISLVLGNLGAMMQSNFKRLLAYSTISHVGFVFIGFAGGGADGFAAAMFYAISYALMATAGFGAIVVMSSRSFEADELADYRGLNQRSPWMAGLILCVMVSLAGVPPFLGFWAKLAVLQAAIQNDMLWLAIVGIVFAVVGAFYYLKVVKHMYFDEPVGELPARVDHRPMRVVFGVNALGLLVLGMAWSPIMEWCQRAFA